MLIYKNFCFNNFKFFFAFTNILNFKFLENKDFFIVARTDARATEGLDAAIERGLQNKKTGADAVFIEAPRSIEEMKKINTDIALLPIGGKFTMDKEEAIKSAKIINANIFIPMHWGSIIGEKEDADDFINKLNILNIQSKILEKYFI